MIDIERILNDSAAAMNSVDYEKVRDLANVMIDELRIGRKIITCGNGGSAAQAMHLTAELVGKFQKSRRPLASVCLNTDVAVLTALANDFGYEEVFTRQIDAIAQRGDIVVFFSTSGRSRNVLRAWSPDIKNVLITGMTTPDIASPPFSVVINVDSNVTARIQEAHQVIIHVLCEIIDEAFA